MVTITTPTMYQSLKQLVDMVNHVVAKVIIRKWLFQSPHIHTGLDAVHILTTGHLQDIPSSILSLDVATIPPCHAPSIPGHTTVVILGIWLHFINVEGLTTITTIMDIDTSNISNIMDHSITIQYHYKPNR